MATLSRHPLKDEHGNYYPDSDGKPMAETPIHRQNLTDLIQMLDRHCAGGPDYYVSGNMFLYYVAGQPKRCLAPDVFFVRGVPRLPERRIFQTWVEGKGPDLVIELTSKKTRREDLQKKLPIYRDEMAVPEYFLFDPYDEYLTPGLQGFRLVEGRYVPIEPVDGRLPSAVVGLHLERAGQQLRLHDPATGRWVPLDYEAHQQAEEARRQSEHARQQAEQARQQAEQARQQTEQARQQADTARQQSDIARHRVETENEALRREVEALRRQLGGQP